MINQLVKVIKEKDAPIVVGLDPMLSYVPEHLVKDAFAAYGETLEGACEAIWQFNKEIVDHTYDLIPAVKPQIAMYEQFGVEGLIVYKRTVDYCQEKGLLVIGDVKRGDIGSTSAAYATAHLGHVQVGSQKLSGFDTEFATVNPYFGTDGVKPFVDVCNQDDKGIFVLVKTSNPSSGEFQDQLVNGKPVYELVAEKVMEWGAMSMDGEYSNVGAVVGATYPEMSRILRKLMPHTYFLVPGYGAQGGTKLACRVSAKRLFPNFSFIDAPFNLQYYKEGNPDTEIAYMGCRTRVIGNAYDPTREIVTGRGNLSFTTINLPRLGIKAQRNIGAFFDSLDELMDLCIDQLMHRFKIQCSKRVRNYPFLMGQGIWLDSEKLTADDTLEEVLKHGTLSVGFIGLAECLKVLTGKQHGESEEARELGLEIISRMRARMDEETKRTGLNFSLLATPAEGLSGRFVKMDRERYGEIAGVTDREYYTNSFHVPVYYPITAFEKLKIEAPYHALTNAGHISYIELDGDPLNNLSAFEKVVRYMKEVGIGYGSINHPVDRDPVCGYTGIIGDKCPKCGRSEAEHSKVIHERIPRAKACCEGDN